MQTDAGVDKIHPLLIRGVNRLCPRRRPAPQTSHMKMSKILVATGRGKLVRKMVRNQEDAYMEVWKLWAWKWMWSSGRCSWEKQNQA